MYVGASDLEKIEKTDDQNEGKGTSHAEKEGVWKGRIFKLGKGEWKRRVCKQIGNQFGSHG